MPILGVLDSAKTGNLVTNNFYSIATTTVGAGGSLSITFSSIPSTYTHLQIRGIMRNTSAAYAGIQNLAMQFNGDTSAAYIYRYNYANGDVTVTPGTNWSGGGSAGILMQWGNLSDGGTANTYGGAIIDIYDYTSTIKYKTARGVCGVSQNGVAGVNSGIGMNSGYWASTAAINSITLTQSSGGYFKQYSSLALYGVK
jgi:hypothetical protein